VTRLKPEDISYLPSGITDYDRKLISNTGYSMRQIACRASGVCEDKILDLINACSVAVIPVTSGRGIITGFSEAVNQIAAHTGFKSFITENTDIAGINEAFEKKSDILMLADDKTFAAFNLKSRKTSENSRATGRGFAAALEVLAGGLKEKKVLVIGCGPVGRGSAGFMAECGAEFSIFDINQILCKNLAEMIKTRYNTDIIIEKSLENALSSHNYIIDASPAENIIKENYIKEGTFISAPGIPLGLTERALEKISNRIFHDPLQTGVATMIIETLTA